MVKAVYFDYHGVLDRRTFGGLLKVLEQAGISGQGLTTLMAAGDAYATGELSPRDWWRQVEQAGGPAAATAGKKYILHVDPIREMWELVNSLHARWYIVGLLSDCPSDKKDIIIRAYNLPDFFEHLIFSCDVGMAKNDQTFFRLMEQAGHYQPSEIVYIDDTERHVAMAQSLGYAAHLFVSPQTTIEYLQNL